jgi:hypothetical protein
MGACSLLPLEIKSSIMFMPYHTLVVTSHHGLHLHPTEYARYRGIHTHAPRQSHGTS